MNCKRCNGDKVVKAGIKVLSKKNNKENIKQQYHCKECGYTFT